MSEVISRIRKSLKVSGASQLKAGLSILQKVLLLLIVGSIVTAIILSHGAVISGKPPVGSIAKKDIRSDRELTVLDRAATEKKKTELIASAGPVFDFDEGIAPDQITRLSNAFRIAEIAVRQIDRESQQAAVGKGQGRQGAVKKIRNDFESALGIQITDREFETLLKNSFSPGILNAISNLLQATSKLNLAARGDLTSVNGTGQILIRHPGSYQDVSLPNIYALFPIDDLPLFLNRNASTILGPVPGDVRDLAVSMVGRMARPNLKFNREATETRKRNLLEQMKPVYYKVMKNEIIVREGQPVTPKAADEIEVLALAHGGGGLSRAVLFLGIFFIVCLMAAVLYRTSADGIRNLEAFPVNLLFLGTLLIIQMIIVRAGILLAEAAHRGFPSFPHDAFYYAVPFAVGPVLAAVFINRNTAFVFTVCSSFLVLFFFDEKITFFLLSFLGSIAAAHQSASLSQRSAIYRAGVLSGLISCLVIIGTALLSGESHFPHFFLKLVCGLSGGALAGVIVSGIAPFLESLFGYTTNIKLLELANLNQPLLQRMIVESPGTYHHSLVVASLVEAAAEAINANPLLAKVSAYYHDIGKLNKPLYFIENQQNWKNKHDKLSPRMSSLVIISHVKEGCDLARRHKLGKTITDIIRQHHGTGIVGYFYEKAQRDKDPSIRSIPESDFRYPGPRPQSKEAGLVLLGDVIEASSRTLTDPTPSRIRNLVQTRIRQIYADGQLDECELTLRDLNRIAGVFERTLNAIFHQRVNYPETAAVSANGRKGSIGLYDFKPPEKIRGRH